MIEHILRERSLCEYKQAWIRIWQDIKKIQDKIKGEIPIELVRKLFFTWYTPEVLNCNVENLLEVEKLRLSLLKLVTETLHL